MEELEKHILAYALQNAIEFGEARVGSVLPKLFQHGLEKSDIKRVMPSIKGAVEKANSMKKTERAKGFEKLKEFVKEKVYEEKDLEELPGSGFKKKMVFRLAPFPSGALHVGHAKTYGLNALYAERYDGDIILVMDDTIGSSEKPLIPEGYKLIEEAFDWLGIQYKEPVIYKSDRLKLYYKYAKKLIEKDKAYVCHCHVEELRNNRAKGIECSCRRFPREIQGKRWKEMFDMSEGHAVLRIKTNMQHPNPAFRDRVLFKISNREHPRVGNKYSVWPSLEMSWAIDDHDLGVTHIIRGNDLMMETEMEKFIWDIFRWKHSEIIHTGLVRLEGVGAKMGKSKAQKEVLSGEFIGWDDPRTWSIQSLARRGITQVAIREFVREIGLNKQDIIVPIENLYALNRRFLDDKANRYSLVLKPKKISIKKSLNIKEIDVPLNPKSNRKRKIKVGKNILVSEDDFKKYKGKEVRLLHLFNVNMKENTEINSLENKKIQKINWVNETWSVEAKVLMPSGEWIDGIAEEGIKRLKKGEIIQFERFGFCRYEGIKNGVHEFWFGHK